MEVKQTWPDIPEAEMSVVATAVLVELEKIATRTEGAVVLALEGDLGAGKTTFSQVLATTLGVVETVTSPTFVIMKQYQTTNPTFAHVVHIDAYRIDDEAELAVLGWEELIQAKTTLVLLEWPSRVSGLLPEQYAVLSLDIADTTRTITLTYGI